MERDFEIAGGFFHDLQVSALDEEESALQFLLLECCREEGEAVGDLHAPQLWSIHRECVRGRLRRARCGERQIARGRHKDRVQNEELHGFWEMLERGELHDAAERARWHGCGIGRIHDKSSVRFPLEAAAEESMEQAEELPGGLLGCQCCAYRVRWLCAIAKLGEDVGRGDSHNGGGSRGNEREGERVEGACAHHMREPLEEEPRCAVDERAFIGAQEEILGVEADRVSLEDAGWSGRDTQLF